MPRYFTIPVFLLVLFFAPPALADVTIGGSCTSGAQSAQSANGNNVVCIGGVWQYPAYQHGSSSASCNSTNAGIVKWTGSFLQFCNGTSWETLQGPGHCSSCNIFGATVPGTVDGGDGTANTLGVSFYSEVGGKITGVRFYKATANTGTHVGYLWDDEGNFLDKVTFSGETASGWQSMSFSKPVLIQPFTVYVAAVDMPHGHYSNDCTTVGFQNAGTDNPPLHAPQDNALIPDGTNALGETTTLGYTFFTQDPFTTSTYPVRNGIYYSGTGAFPSSTFNSCNYYVDVVFSN